jgi:hypothetical protein
LIESAIYFALGFFVAALSMTMSLPALWRRAKRLTMRRLEAQLPISMGEVVAERSLLRARCAMRERRLEQAMRAVTESKAQIMAHAGRQAAHIIDLDCRLKDSESRSAVLDTQLSAANRDVEELSRVLHSTKSELDALKLAKSTLDQAFAQTWARLRVFETRHRDEADIAKVTRAAFMPPTQERAISAKDNLATGEELDLIVAPATSVLFASRSADWGNWAEEAALDALAPAEAVASLQRGAGWEDEDGARLLAETLGGVPISLDLAAAYCKSVKMSFAAYAGRASILIAVASPGRAGPSSVAAAFDLAVAAAVRHTPSSEMLIAFLASCAPQPVPLTLIEGASANKDESMAALGAVTAMSLARRDRFEDGTPAVGVHRLIYSLARARIDAVGGAAAAIERMIIRLTEIYPANGYDSPESWPHCVKLTPHLLAVCETRASDESWGVERADLLVRAGNYCLGRGAYARAESLFQTALTVREREFGAMHPETAASLDNLAALLCAKGDRAGARPLMKRALMIFQTAFGPDYPQAGRHEANYARLLLMIGRPSEALTHAQAALTTLEKSFGPDHAWMVDAVRVTADALDALGRRKKAEALRAHYELVAEASLSPRPNADRLSMNALSKPSLRRQFGLGLAKSWRVLLGDSVAKSH